MPDKKNALAELAENLKHSIVCLKRSHYKGDGLFDIDKAQRIVAELAKVEKPIEHSHIKDGGIVHLAEMLEADKNRDVEIVRNCRIIAMEGANDDK